MKKLIIFGLITIFLLSLPSICWGLNTPSVTEGHGAFIGRYIHDIGLVGGAEYGFADKLAVYADISEKDYYTHIGLKYELSPTLALEGGLWGQGTSHFFLGFNGAVILSKDLQGIGQADFIMIDNNLRTVVDLGLKFNLNRNIDIRGGMVSTIDDGDLTNDIQMGVGYRF